MLYPKIASPFKRFVDGPMRNKFDYTRWSMPEFDLLQDISWTFTEKIDGTNIRIMWDGYRITFGGRTDNAQLHKDLLAHLNNTFTEELFEQTFGEKQVILFGEGYGAGIQNGGNYSQTKQFILFDVNVNGIWLLDEDVSDIASQLGIKRVPVQFVGTLRTAIHAMQTKFFKSEWPDVDIEGVVGRTSAGLLDRRANRIMIKLKYCDFND